MNRIQVKPYESKGIKRLGTIGRSNSIREIRDNNYSEFELKILDDFKTTPAYSLDNVYHKVNRFQLLLDLFIPNSGNTILDRLNSLRKEKLFILYCGKLDLLITFFIFISFAIAIYVLMTTEKYQYTEMFVSKNPIIVKPIPLISPLINPNNLYDSVNINYNSKEYEEYLESKKAFDNQNEELKKYNHKMRYIKISKYILMAIPFLYTSYNAFKRTTVIPE